MIVFIKKVSTHVLVLTVGLYSGGMT